MDRKLIYWTPRILSLLFVGFLAIFSIDVLGNYKGISLVVALFIHMLPSLVLLLFSVAAWKYSLVGGVSFIAFAAIYALEVPDYPLWIIIISGPSFITGILYVLDWYLRKEKILKRR